jgi:multiple sugar transport system substrate-binding protein
MSKIKKQSILALVLVAAILVIAACGPAAQDPAQQPDSTAPSTDQETQDTANVPGEVIHLTYWVINSDPIRLPVLASHVQAFNESQNRIYVEYVPIPQDDALDRINVALAANETPDVTDLMHGWVSGLVLRNALLPLDSHIAGWNESGDMIPALMDEIRNLDPHGGTFMLPATSNTHTIWIRTDWLAEAGITNQHEWTWDDFFTATEAMTDSAQTRFGHTLRGGPGAAATMFEMILGFSGEQAFEDGVSTLNRPHNVEFLERYFALYGVHTPEGDLTAGHMEITANFGAGIAGSMIHNLGSYQNHIVNFESYDMFEAIPMPISRLGTRNLSTSVHGYSIFADTQHPEAAFEFLTWMVNADNNSEWNETLGQLPSNIGVMDDAWFNEAAPIATMSAAINSPITTSFGHPQFLPDFAPINNNIAGPAIQEALLGQITVQELLDMWADALTEAMREYLEFIAQ